MMHFNQRQSCLFRGRLVPAVMAIGFSSYFVLFGRSPVCHPRGDGDPECLLCKHKKHVGFY